MTTPHTPPADLASALEELAKLMEAHPASINFVTLAALMSRVLDGADASARRATSQPALREQMVAAIAPQGFLSPIPDAQQVRATAQQAAR